VIFYRGNLTPNILNKCRVAIVGSRNADREGLAIAGEIAVALAKRGVCIISGLALGVDTAAHKGALESGEVESTIAVLGNGLNSIYPKSNEGIAREIINNQGLILSHFEPESPAYPSNFLDRNRIISGLSSVVVVIEAGAQSGSLVTARNALEQGREVLVVPGGIRNPRYAGSNSLIKQGASVLTSVQDVFEALPREAKSKCTEEIPQRISSELPKGTFTHPILSHLKNHGPMQIDDLRKSLSDFKNFATELLELELTDQIQRLPGNQVALNV